MQCNALDSWLIYSWYVLSVIMTEQVSEKYCEVCGIELKAETGWKRFGKLFCSSEHMEQYVKARQNELGISEERQWERRRIRFGC